MKNEGFEPRLRSIQASSYNDFALNPKRSSWNSISFKYLHSNKYSQLKYSRWLNKILAVLKGAIELRRNRSKIALTYFYNPRFTDSIALMRLSKKLKFPIVVDQTELFSTINQRSLEDEHLIASLANVLMVISQKLKTHFRSIYSIDNVIQIPIAVNFNRFKASQNELNYTIGYLGSFASKDGITDILSAYTKAKQVYPKLKLRLIGHNAAMNGSYVNSTDDIIYTGAIDSDDIPLELAKCDTLILNRVDDEFSTFGFPYKLGEYLAAAKPVLVSDINGFSKEVPDDVVLKYQAANVKALIRSILYRYQNPTEMEELASSGFRFAKRNYDHELVQNKVIKALAPYLKS